MVKCRGLEYRKKNAMKTPLETFIVTDKNQELFEKIKGVTQEKEQPLKLFVVGAKESGKTKLLQARKEEKDFLSTKRVVMQPAYEIINGIKFEAPDEYFEELGSAQVLLLDDFQEFFEEPETGIMLGRLLLQERNDLGLDTIISSSKSLEELDLSGFGEVLNDFQEFILYELDSAGRELLGSSFEEYFFIEEESPHLADDAIRYIANAFAEKPSDIRNAIQYLMTSAGFNPGELLSEEDVKQALS